MPVTFPVAVSMTMPTGTAGRRRSRSTGSRGTHEWQLPRTPGTSSHASACGNLPATSAPPIAPAHSRLSPCTPTRRARAHTPRVHVYPNGEHISQPGGARFVVPGLGCKGLTSTSHIPQRAKAAMRSSLVGHSSPAMGSVCTRRYSNPAQAETCGRVGSGQSMWKNFPRG